jgi:Zn-finger nucleic acid-binding protein
MQCPNDQSTLTMTTREGIEIDYCPQCRGVWLDRGELDKIIERTEQSYGPAAPQTVSPPPSPQYVEPRETIARHDGPSYRGNDYHNDVRRKHKKESFLSDMFDF